MTLDMYRHFVLYTRITSCKVLGAMPMPVLFEICFLCGAMAGLRLHLLLPKIFLHEAFSGEPCAKHSVVFVLVLCEIVI